MKRRDFISSSVAALGTLSAAGAAESLAAQAGGSAGKPIRVLAWSEMSEPKEVYPKGLHDAIAAHLNTERGITAKTAALQDPGQGVPEDALADTDVLIWYGHVRHGAVTDETVARVVRHVKERGMGYLALHSSHFAKPLKALTGTECSWRTYVNDGKPGHIKVVMPDHPIARGVKDFTIPKTEWYGEPFAFPQPEAVVLAGLYNDGKELARDGICLTVGAGRVFYLRFGHEGYPIYYMPQVRRILANSVRWLARQA